MNVKFNQLSNAIRFLSIAAVQKANSGHPGMPMGMADIAAVLFKEHLKFDPENEDSYLYRANTKFSIGDLKGFQEDYDKTKVMASKKGLKWYEGQHLKWVSDVRIEKAVRLQDGRCLVIKQSGPILLTKKVS